ncbi:hypothetical protein KUM39_11115 [Streptomyces sp. J2-1]|uniref:hypothetical protein n=1 Tax=Streptomyces corallincola TaxID=2851888 RepID=UPI001C39563B|nr:hypothetical protein [Streptomyces corallincola]MBV2354910.1 hypothetical protein [Streptomyces corallincola]
MADGNVFAALPGEVVQGGGATDQVGDFAVQLARNWTARTAYDPNDNPPWGDHGDIAVAFAEKYVQPHADLRDALEELAKAIKSAAAHTITSGAQFHGAQSDALDALHRDGGGRR